MPDKKNIESERPAEEQQGEQGQQQDHQGLEQWWKRFDQFDINIEIDELIRNIKIEEEKRKEEKVPTVQRVPR